MTIFWLTYALCVVLAAFIVFYLLRNQLSRPAAALCIILIVLPLLVPFNVPSAEGTGNNFSPAWIAAVFEHIKGDFDRSRAAINAILLVECAFVFAVFAAYFIHRKFGR